MCEDENKPNKVKGQTHFQVGPKLAGLLGRKSGKSMNIILLRLIVQSHAFGTELQEKLLKQELRKKASQKAPWILCVGGASWEEAEETNHRLRLS